MENRAPDGNMYHGISASSGIVIGRAYVLDTHHMCVLRHDISPENVEEECARFEDAVEKAGNEMDEIRQGAIEELDGGALPLTLLDTHQQLLRDRSLTGQVEKIIGEELCNAEWALKLMQEQYLDRFSSIKNSYFRERIADIDQIVTRLQRILIGNETLRTTTSDLTEQVVIVSHDLTPSDTLSLNRNMVIGFCIDAGGKTSHAGLMASSMDIPAVVGLRKLSHNVRSGDAIIVDGNSGEVVHKPTREQFLKYTKRRQNFLYFDETVHKLKDKKAITKDDYEVRVLANIESSGDLSHLKEHGADGVGLYRTEYLYIDRAGWPDESAQFEDYKKVAESVGSNYAVIRTLDFGADKIAAYARPREPEPNPALGLRAIRFCLANPDIFKVQLRAVLRASAFGNLKIMYPLITTVAEIDKANAYLDEAKEELLKEGHGFDDNIEAGIMIETPASVMISDLLAEKADFFSIGTNDLIQYTMAIDRVNEDVAYLYQPLAPAMLRMLKRSIESAKEGGIEISVCGKMAGDPAYALLLMGLGDVHSLSMDVHSIPRIKQFIRSISVSDAAQIAKEILTKRSSASAHLYMSEKMKDFLEEGAGSELVRNVD